MGKTRTLAMDRSSANPGVAVFEGEGCLFSKQWPGLPAQAPAWMDDLAAVLAAHDISPQSLDRLVCGLGPGSFSGIRACLSALQGLALPGECPVLGVASAAVIALGAAAEEGGQVTVVGDARRDRLWWVTYRVFPGRAEVFLADGTRPTQTAADFKLISPDALKETLPEAGPITSPDWNRLEPRLRAAAPAERLVARPVYPLAADLGRLSLAAGGTFCLPAPLPIYLHPAVAKPPPFPARQAT